MRGVLWLVIGLLIVGYAAIQAGKIITTRAEFEKRVNYRLDFVDDASVATVKNDLVLDAGKLGITVRPEDIHITYADTDRATYPQKVAGMTFAKFVNKLVSISLRYEMRMFGIPVRQEIAAHKIKTVQVVVPSRELELDGTDPTR